MCVCVCVCVQTAQRTAKRVDEVDPEEMDRRRAHLKAQRELLLRKKKKEQESKLAAFHEVTRTHTHTHTHTLRAFIHTQCLHTLMTAHAHTDVACVHCV